MKNKRLFEGYQPLSLIITLTKKQAISIILPVIILATAS